MTLVLESTLVTVSVTVHLNTAVLLGFTALTDALNVVEAEVLDVIAIAASPLTRDHSVLVAPVAPLIVRVHDAEVTVPGVALLA